jgi:hypothetical protein
MSFGSFDSLSVSDDMFDNNKILSHKPNYYDMGETQPPYEERDKEREKEESQLVMEEVDVSELNTWLGNIPICECCRGDPATCECELSKTLQALNGAWPTPAPTCGKCLETLEIGAKCCPSCGGPAVVVEDAVLLEKLTKRVVELPIVPYRTAVYRRQLEPAFGISNISFPESLQAQYLQPNGKYKYAAKKFGFLEAGRKNPKLAPFARENDRHVHDFCLVQPTGKRNGKVALKISRLAEYADKEALDKLVRYALSKQRSTRERRGAFGELADFVRKSGRLLLTLGLRELQYGVVPLDSPLQALIVCTLRMLFGASYDDAAVLALVRAAWDCSAPLLEPIGRFTKIDVISMAFRSNSRGPGPRKCAFLKCIFAEYKKTAAWSKFKQQSGDGLRSTWVDPTPFFDAAVAEAKEFHRPCPNVRAVCTVFLVLSKRIAVEHGWTEHFGEKERGMICKMVWNARHEFEAELEVKSSQKKRK